MPLDQNQHDEKRGGLMSFGAHLDELRSRLIWALVVPVVIASVAFAFSDEILDFVTKPLMVALAAEGQPPVVQVLSPSEMVMVKVQLSIWAGVVIAVPWILWQIWRFVAPGLYSSERRYAQFLVPLSTLLVLAGTVLLYLALPFMLRVLINFSPARPRLLPPVEALVEPALATPAPPAANAAPPAAATSAPAAATATPATIPLSTVQIPILDGDPPAARPGDVWMRRGDMQLYLALDSGRADHKLEVHTVPTYSTGAVTQQYQLSQFIDFVLFFAVAIAIAFQMPVAVLLLGWLGIIEVSMLRKFRRHAFFICTIAAAVITPTVDIFSMLVLLVPLYLLYELGIILLHVAPARAVAEGGVMRNALGALFGRRKYTERRTDEHEGDE